MTYIEPENTECDTLQTYIFVKRKNSMVTLKFLFSMALIVFLMLNAYFVYDDV